MDEGETWDLTEGFVGVFSQRESHPCPSVSWEPAKNMWYQSREEERQGLICPRLYITQRGQCHAFNVTIWSLWHGTNASRHGFPSDLTRDCNFFVSRTCGSRSIKCTLRGNAIHSHRFFFLLCIALIRQAKNSVSCSISQPKSIHFFFFFFPSVYICLSDIRDAINSVLSSSPRACV